MAGLNTSQRLVATVRGSDFAIAMMVLAISVDLGKAEKCVGGVLLAHLNRSSGRCDPSLPRIAELAGMSIRNTNRALKDLRRAGLIDWAVHGGKRQCNSYRFDWANIRHRHAAWLEAFRSASKARAVTNPVAQTGQIEADTGDNSVTQTFIKNLNTEPYVQEGYSSRGGAERQVARQSFHRADCPSRSTAHLAACERKWAEAISLIFRDRPEEHAQVIAAIDDDATAAATSAESRKPGEGFKTILAHVANTLAKTSALATAPSPSSHQGKATAVFPNAPASSGQVDASLQEPEQ